MLIGILLEFYLYNSIALQILHHCLCIEMNYELKYIYFFINSNNIIITTSIIIYVLLSIIFLLLIFLLLFFPLLIIIKIQSVFDCCISQIIILSVLFPCRKCVKCHFCDCSDMVRYNVFFVLYFFISFNYFR